MRLSGAIYGASDTELDFAISRDRVDIAESSRNWIKSKISPRFPDQAEALHQLFFAFY